MTFQREQFSESLADEIWPLNQAHHDEVTAFEDIPPSLDRAQYSRFEQSGCFRAFIAREGGRVIGYNFFFIANSPHYSGSLQASEDIFYLSPEFRKGFNGVRFMRWCDGQLKKEGVQVVYKHVTMQGVDFGMILERMGYKAIETVYARRLDQWEDAR